MSKGLYSGHIRAHNSLGLFPSPVAQRQTTQLVVHPRAKDGQGMAVCQSMGGVLVEWDRRRVVRSVGQPVTVDRGFFKYCVLAAETPNLHL